MARRLQMRLAPALAALILAAGAGHALAQVPLDDPLDEHSAKRVERLEKAMKELRAIVFQGRETGAAVVVQPADTQTQIIGLTDKINDLQQTLARVNGQVEVIKHDLDQARQDARDLRAANAAMQERLVALDKSVQTLIAPPAPPPPPVAAVPPDPASAFAAAKSALDGGDIAGAEAGFHDFLDKFGDSAQAPEARYHLAQTLLARRAWSDAATADIGALRGWPKSRWAPDAILDLSRALVAMGKGPDACQTLGELARRYPAAPPATRKSAASLRAQAQCA